MKVSDILRSKGDDVATIDPAAPLTEAAHVLAIRKIGALVVSTDGSDVVGIISERDIVTRFAERGATGLDSPIHGAMTSDVYTCTPSDSVDSLMRVMTDRRIRHLPVIDEGRLAGLVSIGDVVKRRIDELESVTDQLTDYIQTGR